MSKPGEEGSRLGWELVCGGLGGSWRKDGENPEGFDIWESTPTWVDNRSLAEGPLLLTWETWSMVVAPGHSFPVLSFVTSVSSSAEVGPCLVLTGVTGIYRGAS